MSVEANKEIVRQFYAAIQREDYESVARMCHKDFKFYLQVDTPILGAEGFVQSERKTSMPSKDSFSRLKPC